MLHMVIPSLPLSDNHAYLNVVSGKGKKVRTIRVLSPEGRKYKTETTAFIVKTYAAAMPMFKPDTPYGYIVQLHFPNLLNSTWPEKAQTRYKKLDALNRSKLFQDAMADALGIDDSNFLSTRFDKLASPVEATHVWLWNMEEGSGV